LKKEGIERGQRMKRPSLIEAAKERKGGTKFKEGLASEQNSRGI